MPAAWSRRRRRRELFARRCTPIRATSSRACRASATMRRKGLEGARRTSPIRRPGCRFHPRCPLADGTLPREAPPMIDARAGAPRRLLCGERRQPHDGAAARARACVQDLRPGRPALAPARAGGARCQLPHRGRDGPRSSRIIGQSGSGKTTIARMILGIVPPTSGAFCSSWRTSSRTMRGARARMGLHGPRCSRSSRTPSRPSIR